MLAVPTTTVAIYRDSPEQTDQYGDPIDSDVPIQSGIPASLIEQTRLVDPPAGTTPRTISYVTCRVAAGTDVTGEDRIKDESTSFVYTISDVSTPQSPVHQQDMKLVLERVGS